MAMSKSHKKALEMSLEVLADDLDVTPVIIHLKSKSIITDIDEEKINAKTTSEEKVSEFVKILKARGKKAYPAFISYLQHCDGSAHLAEEIEDKLKLVEEQLSGLKKRKEDEEQLQKWKCFEHKFSLITCLHESIDGYQHISEEINLLLIGKTGSGKSCTGNTLIGEDFFMESGTSSSVTKTISERKFNEARFRIQVIDTPGLFDTAKDFNNRDLMLEIAKTVFSFTKGIHLILIVLNSVRFTAEEQGTIEAIENVLSKDVYNNCILVITNARGKFGSKKHQSLDNYITNEKQEEGKFADLLHRIQNRVIAVENCFDDEFLTNKQRQMLLCTIGQVLHDNNGKIYSNKLFENTQKRVEKEERVRKDRIVREKELSEMKKFLRKYLLEKYLLKLNENQLADENLQKELIKNGEYIMHESGVGQFEYVNKNDFRAFVKEFVKGNKGIISNMRTIKTQERKNREEMERKSNELKRRTDLNKMEVFVLCHIGNLKSRSKEQLQQFIDLKSMPLDEVKEISMHLNSVGIDVDESIINTVVQQKFNENYNTIQNYLADKELEVQANEMTKKLEEAVFAQHKQIEKLENEKSRQDLIKMLLQKINSLLEHEPDDEIKKLLSALETLGEDVPGNWEALVTKILTDSGKKEIKHDLKSLSKLCLEQNAQYLGSMIHAILEKRKMEVEDKERQRKETEKNNALSSISNVIDNKLKSYLIGKSNEDLMAIQKSIDQNKVPKDIYELVSKELTQSQQEAAGQNTIEQEIITQINQKKKVIEKSVTEAQSCFAASSTVTKPGGYICNISSLRVGDKVLVYDSKHRLYYEYVYLISHANKLQYINYIRLSTKTGKALLISSGHLLPVGNVDNITPAEDVAVGDIIFTVQNGVMKPDIVMSITYERSKGAYCPMTMTGTVVVNDSAASCYTNFIQPYVAHVLLAPFRCIFNYLPRSVFDKLLSYDQNEGMPVLFARCRSSIMTWRSVMRYIKGYSG